MEDLESKAENIAAKCEALVAELRDLMEKADKKIEELIGTESAFCPDVITDKQVQEVFKERMKRLQSGYFCSEESEDGNGNLKISPKIKTNNLILILLKRKIQKFKKEQERVLCNPLKLE